ncbi:MAG: hypothetical protein Q9165_001944 [Trypethelium subeluteriae]
MYLFQALLTTLALTTATLTTAAPHASNTTSGPSLQRVSDIIKELENQGALNWKNHTHGRTSTIFPHQQEAALSSLTRPSKRDGLGSWNGVGSISGLTSKAACYGSGKWLASNVAKTYVSSACDSFLSSFTAGRLLNGAWTVWQNSPQVQDPVDSGMDIINFSLQPKGNNPPPLTKQMCQQAFDLLVTSQCQSGHHQGDSQGGQVEIGDDHDGAQMFELDPNDVKYGVTT